MKEQPTLIKFYTDTHIAKTVATQLQEKGVDIVRCEDVDLAEATDAEHLEYATREGRVMVTGDDDFLRLHAQWQDENRSHAGIIYCPPHLQGRDHVGPIISMILDYHMLIAGGAGTVEDDVANRVIFVR